jgi:hypothetical protein
MKLLSSGTRKKQIIIFCIISFALIIPLTSAIHENYLSGSQVRIITSDNLSAESGHFVFSGDYILWKNVYSQDGTAGSSSGLYLFSLGDNSTRPIVTANSTGGTWINWHTMSGERAVWYQYPGSLHEYIVKSGEVRNIPGTDSEDPQKTYSWNGEKEIARWMPSTDGNRVAWLQGFPSGTYDNADIALWNDSSGETILIDETLSAKGGLVLNGDNIVWYSYEDGSHRKTSIHLHNITTGIDTVVSPGEGLQTQTAVSGNYIAWTDFHDPLNYPVPTSQVNIFNISSRTKQTIPGEKDQYDPFFGGDFVVYTECSRNDPSAVNRDCYSKIFDPTTRTVWQFPPEQDDLKILGFSDGQFLVEENRGRNGFAVLRIADIPLIKKTSAAENQVAAGENMTATDSPVNPPSPQPSPGFDIPLLITILLITTGTFRDKLQSLENRDADF